MLFRIERLSLESNTSTRSPWTIITTSNSWCILTGLSVYCRRLETMRSIAPTLRIRFSAPLTPTYEYICLHGHQNAQWILSLSAGPLRAISWHDLFEPPRRIKSLVASWHANRCCLKRKERRGSYQSVLGPAQEGTTRSKYVFKGSSKR